MRRRFLDLRLLLDERTALRVGKEIQAAAASEEASATYSSLSRNLTRLVYNFQASAELAACKTLASEPCANCGAGDVLLDRVLL